MSDQLWEEIKPKVTWGLEKVNVEGILNRIIPFKFTKKNGKVVDSFHYELRTNKGIVIVNGHRDLNQIFNNLVIGDAIKISYSGKGKDGITRAVFRTWVKLAQDTERKI